MRDAREEAAKKSVATEDEDGKNLVWYQVPELGIEFQIKKEAADERVYIYESYPKNVPFGSAFFTAKGLDPGCKMGGVMIVHRFEGVPANYDANMMMGGELKQFDGFFIKFYGPQCASDKSFINWTERVRGENPQVDVWITGILETMRKTSQQPAMNKKSAEQESLLKETGQEQDLVWYQIPELGIRFKVTPDSRSDLKYTIVYAADTKQHIAYFYKYQFMISRKDKEFLVNFIRRTFRESVNLPIAETSPFAGSTLISTTIL